MQDGGAPPSAPGDVVLVGSRPSQRKPCHSNTKLGLVWLDSFFNSFKFFFWFPFLVLCPFHPSANARSSPVAAITARPRRPRRQKLPLLFPAGRSDWTSLPKKKKKKRKARAKLYGYAKKTQVDLLDFLPQLNRALMKRKPGTDVTGTSTSKPCHATRR